MFTTMLENFDLSSTLLNTTASLILGIIIALFYMHKSTYTKSFVVTLALLPAIVMAVISLVNGSIGAGIAVMGAFSLVRFRSIPGTAREIGFLFFAMAVGLGTGMGYVLYAAVFTVIVGLMSMLLYRVKFGEQKNTKKELKITIPENLEYSGLFSDLFEQYTSDSKLIKVKTSNMGSLYQLTYSITLKNEEIEKEFIDKLRCRNGNLDIMCGQTATTSDVL